MKQLSKPCLTPMASLNVFITMLPTVAEFGNRVAVPHDQPHGQANSSPWQSGYHLFFACSSLDKQVECNNPWILLAILVCKRWEFQGDVIKRKLLPIVYFTSHTLERAEARTSFLIARPVLGLRLFGTVGYDTACRTGLLMRYVRTLLTRALAIITLLVSSLRFKLATFHNAAGLALRRRCIVIIYISLNNHWHNHSRIVPSIDSTQSRILHQIALIMQ